MEYRYRVRFSAFKEGREVSGVAELPTNRPLESTKDGADEIRAAISKRFAVTDVDYDTVELM